MFLKFRGLTNWQEATQLISLYTTREILEHFISSRFLAYANKASKGGGGGGRGGGRREEWNGGDGK